MAKMDWMPEEEQLLKAIVADYKTLGGDAWINIGQRYNGSVPKERIRSASALQAKWKRLTKEKAVAQQRQSKSSESARYTHNDDSQSVHIGERDPSTFQHSLLDRINVEDLVYLNFEPEEASLMLQ